MSNEQDEKEEKTSHLVWHIFPFSLRSLPERHTVSEVNICRENWHSLHGLFNLLHWVPPMTLTFSSMLCLASIQGWSDMHWQQHDGWCLFRPTSELPLRLACVGPCSGTCITEVNAEFWTSNNKLHGSVIHPMEWAGGWLWVCCCFDHSQVWQKTIDNHSKLLKIVD